MKQLITALILVATAVTAQAGPIEDALVKTGFNKTNRGTNATVYATYERSMNIQTCNRFIGNVAGNLGVAPVNIVETASMRVVRFRNVEAGSILLTCNGNDLIVSLSRNPG